MRFSGPERMEWWAAVIQTKIGESEEDAMRESALPG
jgi:hypothetical protein